jgi:hypothetical protein
VRYSNSCEIDKIYSHDKFKQNNDELNRLILKKPALNLSPNEYGDMKISNQNLKNYEKTK